VLRRESWRGRRANVRVAVFILVDLYGLWIWRNVCSWRERGSVMG
jgi:hypothetical protein